MRSGTVKEIHWTFLLSVLGGGGGGFYGMGEEEVKVAKDFSTVERVERITVGLEVVAEIQLTLGELAAVEVTLGELEVLMKIPLVVVEEDLLTVEQIRKMNVVIIRLEMVK